MNPVIEQLLSEQCSACTGALPKTGVELNNMLWDAFNRGRAYEKPELRTLKTVPKYRQRLCWFFKIGWTYQQSTSWLHGMCHLYRHKSGLLRWQFDRC